MPYSDFIKKSLLFTLKPEQIDSLIQESEIIGTGYQFEYVIDPHDILQYCFPVNFDEEDVGDANLYLTSDSLNGYEYLFGNSKPILLTEYGEELIHLHNGKIKKYFNRAKELKGWIDPFLKSLIDNKEIFRHDKAALEELLLNNMSIIAAMALVVSVSSLDRYRSLFDEKKLLLEDDVSDLPDEGDYLFGTKYESLLNKTFQRFENFIESRPDFYYKQIAHRKNKEFESVKKTRQFLERKNAFFDAGAISKVIMLNKWARNQSEKRIFLYMSSASWSHSIISQADFLQTKINNRSHSILRNQAQLFAQLVFRPYLKKSQYDYISRLKVLKDLLVKYSIQKDVGNELYSEFVEDLENTKNDLENASLVLQYQKLKTRLKVALSNDNKEIGTLIDILNTVVSSLSKSPLKYTTKDLDYFLNRVERKKVVHKLILDADLIRTRNYGADPVESIKQQLPVVFDYESLKNKYKLKNIIKSICYYFIQYEFDSNKEKDFKRILLAKNLNTLGRKSHERLLIEYLSYLIVPITDPKIKPNKIVFEQIAFVLRERVNQLSGSESSDVALIKELKYIQVWAARRAMLYKEGLRLSLSYCAEYKDDPRFYHSAALTIYSWVHSHKQGDYKPKPTSTMKDAVYFSYRARKYYKIFRDRGIIEANYSIEALMNTSSHFLLLIAKEELDRNDTDKARIHLLHSRNELDRLKDWLKQKRTTIRKYSEYLSTEADLEFLEYQLYSRENLDSKKLLNKLNHALDAITESIKKSKGNNTKIKERNASLKKSIEEEIMTITKSKK